MLGDPDKSKEPDYAHSKHHHGLPHERKNLKYDVVGREILTNKPALNAIPLSLKIAMPVTVKSLAKNRECYLLQTLAKLKERDYVPFDDLRFQSIVSKAHSKFMLREHDFKMPF